MNGKDLFSGLSYISKKYINEAENETVSGTVGKFEAPRHGKTLFHKSLLIAAAIAAMLFLMGAAVYTHWSGSMQRYYQPTEKAKQQAEKSGLSVMYQEESKPEDGSILSATDQGITVSVVQTLVDQGQAKIVLRIEGFTPPEETLVQPIAWWNEDPPTLDGNSEILGSVNVDFDTGTTITPDWEEIYWDGAPVEHYEDGWPIYHYTRNDGSMELVVWYRFQDTSGEHLGKEYALHLTGFGIARQKGPADDTFEKLVDGHWDLRFPLTGSNESIKATPNVRLSDNVTLTEAEIGEIFIKTQYKTDTYFAEWEELGILQPDIAGVKLKDGTLIKFFLSSEGYSDQDNLIYFKEAYATDGIVDLAQVDSLVYYERWDQDPETGKSVPVYKYVPLS